MSRSHKKKPFCGNTTVKSEKQDKRIANRQDRRSSKVTLEQTQDDTDIRSKKEISSVWDMGKDGKKRFDPKNFPKGMRK